MYLAVPVFSCGMWGFSLEHVESDSLTGDGNQAPCIGPIGPPESFHKHSYRAPTVCQALRVPW